MLPPALSKKIISLGRTYKRRLRDKARSSQGKDKPFVREIDTLGVSFKIVLDPLQNAGVDEHISRDGFWEQDLGKQLLRHITKDGVFLDIGANIGYHSLFVASILKGTGKVYAFEPIERLCKQLHESVTINNFSNIEICNFGISKKEGSETIYLRDENIGGSTLLSKLDDFKLKETQTVRLRGLDSFLGENAKVDVIKIDIEGYEYEALKSAAALLAHNHPVIFMEFSPRFYAQDYARKAYDLASFLKSFGYSFFTLDETPLDIFAWLNEGNNAHAQIDLMCRVNQK